MRLPFFRPKGGRPGSGPGLEAIRSVFSKFKRIQKLNTRALELMAEMEQALGGGYIFDRAFLESSVRTLGTLTYQVVYSLNAMSGNRYVGLYDRFQSIKSTLDDILGGGLGPFAVSLTLPYQALGLEMEPLVGTLNACLAEAGFRLGLSAPDGFAVTTTGCRLFLEANGINGTPSGQDAREPAASPAADRLDTDRPQGDQPHAAPGESLEAHEALAGAAPVEAALPPELEQAIEAEVQSLLSRRRSLDRLWVRVCSAGGPEACIAFGAETGAVEETDPGAAVETRPGDILATCRRVLAEHAAGTASDRPFEQAPFALAVHEAVPAAVVGSITARAAAGFQAGLFSVTASPASAPDRAERYLLRRIYPFDLVQSEVSPASLDRPLVPLSKAIAPTAGGLQRGSSLLDPAFLKAVAQSAMTIERMLGCVKELHWAGGGADRPVLVDVRPSAEPAVGDIDAIPICDIDDELEGAEVLLHGGATVQAGIVAGRAVHVEEGADAASFPHGAVAVARVASPWLSPFLSRASAVVTELGTSISHLATVARELRVPAVFGAAEALARIPDGAEVTVDAAERTVYRGVVEPLLACRDYTGELYPDDPEYVTLRRLLRWIMPLELIDPDSEEFAAENCRSFHDIIHFAHERSVDALLNIQDRGRGLTDLKAEKIELGVPVDLFVIDLGGGVSAGAPSPMTLEDVTSEPFHAFLRGLTMKDMWSRGPGSLKLRDIFSGLDRTFAAMTGPPEFAGMNHAIVAENYMNLGLRLGYHFSVIDAFLSSNVNQNNIYFRFVGGFADERRRLLRAELIRTVLEEMRFKVLVKGDLVVGKFKIAAREEMAAALVTLGELTGFTRQLDLTLSSEEKVRQFAELFRKKSIGGSATNDEGQAADA